MRSTFVAFIITLLFPLILLADQFDPSFYGAHTGTSMPGPIFENVSHQLGKMTQMFATIPAASDQERADKMANFAGCLKYNSPTQDLSQRDEQLLVSYILLTAAQQMKSSGEDMENSFLRKYWYFIQPMAGRDGVMTLSDADAVMSCYAPRCRLDVLAHELIADIVPGLVHAGISEKARFIQRLAYKPKRFAKIMTMAFSTAYSMWANKKESVYNDIYQRASIAIRNALVTSAGVRAEVFPKNGVPEPLCSENYDPSKEKQPIADIFHVLQVTDQLGFGYDELASAIVSKRAPSVPSMGGVQPFFVNVEGFKKPTGDGMGDLMVAMAERTAAGKDFKNGFWIGKIVFPDGLPLEYMRPLIQDKELPTRLKIVAHDTGARWAHPGLGINYIYRYKINDAGVQYWLPQVTSVQKYSVAEVAGILPTHLLKRLGGVDLAVKVIAGETTESSRPIDIKSLLDTWVETAPDDPAVVEIETWVDQPLQRRVKTVKIPKTARPVVNLAIHPFLAGLGISYRLGKPPGEDYTFPVVTAAHINRPAYLGGVRDGDTLIALNDGDKVYDFKDMSSFGVTKVIEGIQKTFGRPVTLQVRRRTGSGVETLNLELELSPACEL